MKINNDTEFCAETVAAQNMSDDVKRNEFICDFINFSRHPDPHEWLKFKGEFIKLSHTDKSTALLDILIILNLLDNISEGE